MTKQNLVKVVATKAFTYANKQRSVGEELNVSAAHARVLEAIKKVRIVTARDAAELPPMPQALRDRAMHAANPAVPPPSEALKQALHQKAGGLFDHDGDGRAGGSSAPEGDADVLTALRREYFDTLGKRPFPGWDADTLREKIAAAKASPDQGA